MAIKQLNHYTLISDDLEANILFYENIVGLKLSPNRSKGVAQFIDFAFPGEDHAVVSVIDGAHPFKNKKNDRDNGFQLHGTVNEKGKKHFATGPFEHICFSYDEEDFETIKKKLKDNNFECREGFDFMPDYKQLWTLDPNGVKVEFLFQCKNQ